MSAQGTGLGCPRAGAVASGLVVAANFPPRAGGLAEHARRGMPMRLRMQASVAGVAVGAMNTFHPVFPERLWSPLRRALQGWRAPRVLER